MAKRRDHGEGSIFFEESRGRWVGLVDLGFDASGRRRRPKVTGKTRNEVRRKLDRLRQRNDEGLPVGDASLTVAAFLEDYLANVIPAQVQNPNTRENYRYIIEDHIVPALGRKRIQSLTPEDVERFLREKAGADFSRSVVARCRTYLQRALRQAERRGYVARNVASLVDTPPAKAAREGRTLSVEDAHKLLAAATGDRLEALVVTGLMLGLRPGELLGLRWPDIDLEARLVHIRQSLKRNAVTSELSLGPLKTKRSFRTLRMPTAVRDALSAHRDHQVESEAKAGAEWRNDEDLVFTTAVGTPLDPSNLRRAVARLCAKAEIGHWTPYELRHSAASLLSAAGVRIEEIADLLGHTDTRMLERHYRHLTSPEISAAVTPMDELFGVGAPSVVGHAPVSDDLPW